MKPRHLAAALVVACSARAQASPVPRTPVSDPRPLMIAALNAPDGAAHGLLTGATADAITQKFKSGTPIFIDVTTLKRYTQAGCSRLKVLFWQDGVRLPGMAAPRKQTIEFGINYCRDGLPPRSLTAG
jgi:hypothetical protein